MNSRVDEFLLNVRIADGLDVLILSLVIYLAWRWLQRRAARSIVIALVGFGLLYVLSKALSMYLTVAVFQAGLTVMLLALVIVFQDDLRHAVERVSTWRLFAPRSPPPPGEGFIDTLVEAVTLLARERIGALIVLPGRQPLERHVRGGVPVDALVSTELLHSVFHTASRGHDGGVIIRKDRMDRLGVHLPLSANFTAVGNRGTRHAAALGLAERCDAQVIVVSEERGTIALAKGDRLLNIDTAAELESHLLSFLEAGSADPASAQSFRQKCNVWGARLGSLIIATILWFVFAFHVDTVQRTIDDVPVEFRNLPEAWVLESAAPKSVQLTLVGPERAFAALDENSLKVAVNLGNTSVDHTTTVIGDEHLTLPEGISMQDADPAILRYQLRQPTTLKLPVRVLTQGNVPQGWELLGVTADPATLTVRTSPQHQDTYDHLPTEPIDLSHVRATKTVTAQIQLPPELQLVGRRDADVAVQVKVRRLPSPTSVIHDQQPPDR